MMRKFQPSFPRSLPQKGAALIFFVFLIGLAATVAALKTFNVGTLVRTSQDDRAAKLLAEAKEALIGYTLSRVSGTERPGDLPRPDYFPASEVPANYDGEIDGGCLDASQVNGLPLVNTGSNMRCLGRLPWKAIGMSISSPSQNDSIGIMPWYAASANLTDSICMSVINPSILNLNFTTHVCGSTTQLPHPWLTVRDYKGNIISDRVAFLVILPAASINGQQRPATPLSGAASYLDSVTVPVSCTAPCIPGTYSNSDMDNDFIMASGLTGTASSINDRLLFMTIDELMPHLVKRAALATKQGLNNYNTAFTHYPYAANLNATGSNFTSSGTTTSGTLPVDGSHTISCSSANQCNYNFADNILTNIAHTRTTGTTYNFTFGSCTWIGRTCTCTGDGGCIRLPTLTAYFQCASSVCFYTGGGTGNRMTLTPVSSLESSNVTGACTITGANAQCTGAGNSQFSFIVADWFRDNLWKEYFYYTFDAGNNIQVGNRSGITALLVGFGNPITSAPLAIKGSAQARPSMLINDYLDSAENTDGDLLFDAINTPLSASYNDQSIIISP